MGTVYKWVAMSSTLGETAQLTCVPMPLCTSPAKNKLRDEVIKNYKAGRAEP